jgi:hypothetical protein
MGGSLARIVLAECGHLYGERAAEAGGLADRGTWDVAPSNPTP